MVSTEHWPGCTLAALGDEVSAAAPPLRKGERDVHYSFGPGSSFNISRGRGTAALFPEPAEDLIEEKPLARWGRSRGGVLLCCERRAGRGAEGTWPARQENLVAVPYAWVARRSARPKTEKGRRRRRNLCLIALSAWNRGELLARERSRMLFERDLQGAKGAE